MSRAAVALRCRVESPGVKLVLVALTVLADEEWRCRATKKALAEATQLSVRSVQRYLVDLERRGLITRVARHDESGARLANRIDLRLPGS